VPFRMRRVRTSAQFVTLPIDDRRSKYRALGQGVGEGDGRILVLERVIEIGGPAADDRVGPLIDLLADARADVPVDIAVAEVDVAIGRDTATAGVAGMPRDAIDRRPVSIAADRVDADE